MADSVQVQVFLDKDYQDGTQKLRRLFQTVAPNCTPGDTLVDIAAQIENYITGFICGDRWDLEKWRQEYGDLLKQCDSHCRERNKLATALQQIALLGDTGSQLHKQHFAADAPGWRVAEKMRDIALSVVGNMECETCHDDGQVKLQDEGGNSMWWPCPVCRPPN